MAIFFLVLSILAAASAITPTIATSSVPSTTLDSSSTSTTVTENAKPVNYILQIVEAALITLLYGFAYYVAHAYRPTGLRVVRMNRFMSLKHFIVVSTPRIQSFSSKSITDYIHNTYALLLIQSELRICLFDLILDCMA